jgi:hypothetical protein
VLVRPDNHVAWRSVGATPSAVASLRDAFRKILMRERPHVSVKRVAL